MTINSHKFRDTVFDIRWPKKVTRTKNGKREELDGSCIKSTKVNRICINRNLKGFRKLEVMVDESIHACFWDLDDDMVRQASRSIARFLWRNGWREVE